MAVKGVIVALIISYFQNGALVKCISKVLVVYTVSIIMYFAYGTQLEAAFVAGTLIFTYGGWLYFVPAEAATAAINRMRMKMKAKTGGKVKSS